MRQKYAHLSGKEVEERLRQIEELLQESLTDPALRKLLEPSEIVKGEEICLRLIVGTLGFLGVPGNDRPDSLNPRNVSLFLATIANSKPIDLSWVVRRGLKALGIERPSRRGRPKKRRSETEHVIQFRVFEELIRQRQLWEKKQEFKQKFPRNWQEKFCKSLRDDGWNADEIELALMSTTPRSLALQMAANHCKVDYDSIRTRDLGDSTGGGFVRRVA
jgi:hypothetical protein